VRIERLTAAGYHVYPSSREEVNGLQVALVRGSEGKRLFVSSRVHALTGDALPGGGLVCPLSYENARVLTSSLPWLSPRRLPEGQSSFGFGDRIGLATPGHVRAVEGADVFPILAQQSVRENARTGRTFQDVLAQAVYGALQEGYRDGFGADADHLKTIEDAVRAAELGYTFFTCDPSEHLMPVKDLGTTAVAERFRELPEAERLLREYAHRESVIAGLGAIRFTEEELARAAVKYGDAVRFAVDMYRALADRCSDGFDFELSVDETDSPTSLVEHLFIAFELGRQNVELASLAPRLPGAMEKAIDWYGDLNEFRQELHAHATIARAFGPYRLSLHSGSDKFSIYRLLAEETDGLWHVKTAGTSYLVALEVAVREAPSLFKRIARHSLGQFAEERATYHLSTDMTKIPNPDGIADDELMQLLSQDEGRQVLHVAFGSVLRSSLGNELREMLETREDDHHLALSCHLGRHLDTLGVRRHV